MSVTPLGLLRSIRDERDLILISGVASSRVNVDTVKNLEKPGAPIDSTP